MNVFGLAMLHLLLATFIVAWLFERGGRCLSIAIAAHASGHLDNIDRAPSDEVRLVALRHGVLAVAAVLAAAALVRTQRQRQLG